VVDSTKTDNNQPDRTTPTGDGPPEPPSDALAAELAAAREVDPHGLRVLIEALSPRATEAGRAAIAVLSVLLRDDEQVNDLAVGQLAGANAVVALTDQRVVLASDRRYRADAFEFPLAPGLEVEGWQDGAEATVIVRDKADSVTLEHVIDRPAAQRFAAGVELALGD